VCGYAGLQPLESRVDKIARLKREISSRQAELFLLDPIAGVSSNPKTYEDGLKEAVSWYS